MLTDSEKLLAIKKLAAAMGTHQDEYAVDLASSVLEIIDGRVSYNEIYNRANDPGTDTVGDALKAALDVRLLPTD